jgi:imidazolonepropionase-like amidohydrolase
LSTALLDRQTVTESVTQRVITATLAAKADVLAGFTAVREAIDHGLIPGPHMRASGNAINILGGHEDAIHFKPDQHVLPNATYANTSDELVTVIRQQIKDGADFIKIYAAAARLLDWVSFFMKTRLRLPALAIFQSQSATNPPPGSSMEESFPKSWYSICSN